MRQISGLGIWRRVECRECRALQRYGGNSNSIKVQSAPLGVFPSWQMFRCLAVLYDFIPVQ